MKLLVYLAGLLCSLSFARAESYDTIIRGGRIVDGTGNPAYFADVGIKRGRITKIGRIPGQAGTKIDAKGMTDAENFLRMGVTTIVAGNCGGSALDVGKAFREIERKKVSINFATLIGHNTVRHIAMGGDFDRPPTSEELAKMKSLVEQAMQDGAVGLSTGLIYLPGVFAKTDEIVELAKVASACDGIYASHMRHEDSRIYEALDEVFRIAREAHIRAEVSHIKLAGERSWGQADKVLAYIEKARAEGLDITEDQYAYTASSTGISQLIPDEAFDGGREKFLERLADPAAKEKIVRGMKAMLRNRGREDYAYAVIASYGHDKSNGGASGVFHGMNEDDLQKFMRHPNTMVACDSGLRKPGEGVPHPRGYGNNARVLGRYVRELKTLRLEDAIRKMTSLPASAF